MEDRYTDLRFSPHGTAFLTDAIIMQRYIELRGQLQRVMAVVKVRGAPTGRICVRSRLRKTESSWAKPSAGTGAC
jgi:hypothetical protein